MKTKARPTTENTAPTLEQFSAYQSAWEYFNKSLFNDELKPCLLNFSRHSQKTMGYFIPDKWSRDGNGQKDKAHPTNEDTIHEISLNPDVLRRPLIDTMSTLVHEMCHHWQQQCGSPPRKAYHNKEWSNKMEQIGLMPSNTGKEGGKRTGAQMTHYIIEGGEFEHAFKSMPESYLIPWRSSALFAKPKEKNRNKIKYECKCGVNVWGKPGLNIVCGECENGFTEQD